MLQWITPSWLLQIEQKNKKEEEETQSREKNQENHNITLFYSKTPTNARGTGGRKGVRNKRTLTHTHAHTKKNSYKPHNVELLKYRLDQEKRKQKQNKL